MSKKRIKEAIKELIDKIWFLHLNGRISNSPEARKDMFMKLHRIMLRMEGKKKCSDKRCWCYE